MSAGNRRAELADRHRDRRDRRGSRARRPRSRSASASSRRTGARPTIDLAVSTTRPVVDRLAQVVVACRLGERRPRRPDRPRTAAPCPAHPRGPRGARAPAARAARSGRSSMSGRRHLLAGRVGRRRCIRRRRTVRRSWVGRRRRGLGDDDRRQVLVVDRGADCRARRPALSRAPRRHRSAAPSSSAAKLASGGTSSTTATIMRPTVPIWRRSSCSRP